MKRQSRSLYLSIACIFAALVDMKSVLKEIQRVTGIMLMWKLFLPCSLRPFQHLIYRHWPPSRRVRYIRKPCLSHTLQQCRQHRRRHVTPLTPTRLHRLLYNIHRRPCIATPSVDTRASTPSRRAFSGTSAAACAPSEWRMSRFARVFWSVILLVAVPERV